jgi:two-component system response regulator
MKKFILFVDDDRLQACLFEAVCRRIALRDFTVLSDGAAAIEYFKQVPLPQKPDLVVTDLKMPLVDGLELLKWLKQNEEFKSLPVYILTASCENHQRKVALEWGCAGIHEKPAGLAEMQQLIISLIGKVPAG